MKYNPNRNIKGIFLLKDFCPLSPPGEICAKIAGWLI